MSRCGTLLNQAYLYQLTLFFFFFFFFFFFLTDGMDIQVRSGKEEVSVVVNGKVVNVHRYSFI